MAVGVFLAVLAMPALAQLQASEPELKAAFMYRFLSFVEWPSSRFASPKSPLVVAFVGAPPVAAEFRSAVQGRTVHGRPIEVGDTMVGAHAIFIGESAAASVAAVARSAAPGTLIVTDTEGGLDRGATINLVEVDGRLRFSVSIEAAERAGLRLNSRLLAVATEVRGGRP